MKAPLKSKKKKKKVRGGLLFFLNGGDERGLDMDGAPALDVSEAGAVEVDLQRLLPGLVGN